MLISARYGAKIYKKAMKSYEAVINIEKMLLQSTAELDKAKPIVPSSSLSLILYRAFIRQMHLHRLLFPLPEPALYLSS